jgi:hypothetical protein
MESRELDIESANEYLLGILRALLEFPEFRKFVDKNFVINQYYDDTDGSLLRVEVKNKADCDEPPQESGVLH